MTEINLDLRASNSRNQGADWNDVFEQTGGYGQMENGPELLQAIDQMQSNRAKFKPLSTAVKNAAGMAAEAADQRVNGLVDSLETQYDVDKEGSLQPFRAAYAKHRDDNLRSAAEDILLSGDSPSRKKARLMELAAQYGQPETNDIRGYAHYAAATNPNIPDSQKAALAEEVAGREQQAPEVMVQQAMLEFDADKGLGAVDVNVLKHAAFGMSTKDQFRIFDKIGITADVARKSTFQIPNDPLAWADDVAVSSRIAAFHSMYSKADANGKAELTQKAIAAIRSEYGGDKLFAIDMMDRLFAVQKGDRARFESTSNVDAWQVVDVVGGVSDAASIASGVKAVVKTGAEALEVAKELKKVRGYTLADAFGELNTARKASMEAAKKAGIQNAMEEYGKNAARIFKSPDSIAPGTAANIDAMLNPSRLATRMQEALDAGVDTRNLEAYGLDAEKAMTDGVLPSMPEELVKGIPSIADKVGISKLYDEAITAISRGVSRAFASADHIYLRGQELAAIDKKGADEVVQAFRDANFGEVDLNKTSQMPINDGFLTQYLVTGKQAPFSAEDALRAATVYNTHADDTVRMMYKAPGTDKFLPVEVPVKFAEDGTPTLAKKMPDGEYGVALVRQSVYDPNLAEGSKMALEGHLQNLNIAASQLDKSSQIAKDVADMSTYAIKQRGLIEASLHDAMKPFSELGGLNAWKKQKSQARVMEALMSGVGGDGPGKFYNANELIENFGLNADEITAYYGVRARFDVEYFLNNLARRNELVEGGFSKELEIGGVKHFLREVGKDENALAGIKRVATVDGTIYDVTPELLANTEFVVYKSHAAMVKDGQMTSYLIARASDAVPEGAYFGKMRDEVLPYHQGYIPRIYDANYIVTQTFEVIDEFGKAVTYEKAVASAQTQRAAFEFANKLGLDPAKNVRFAREAMPTGRSSFDRAGRKRAYNGIIFGKRGTALEDAEIGHIQDLPQIDTPRNLKSLSDVLNSSAGLTSFRQTMDKAVSRTVDRWNAAYEKHGWNLATIKQMGMPNEPALLQEYRDAMAIRDHIAMLQGVDETVMNKLANVARMKLANSAANGLIRNAYPKRVWQAVGKVTGITADSIETNTLKQINRGFDSTIKSLSFTAFLGLNPTAQIVLQAMQATAYIGLKGGMSYTLKGQNIRDFMGVMMGVKLRGTGPVADDVLDTVARAMGMNRKEYDAFLNSFEASGIMQGIDRHQFLESIATSDMVSGITDGTVASSIKASTWYASQFVNKMRQLGFDAGELTNQTMAWLYSRQRMIADNPELAKTINHDPNVWKQLSVMATNISGNMDQSARLKHQDGLLGLILQFTSYGTKMSQMMIPRYLPLGNKAVEDAYFNILGRFGSDIYSNREKLRIAMVQLGLFGTAGTGLLGISGSSEIPGTDIKPGSMGYWLADTYMQDNGINPYSVPPEARDAVAQGMMGTMMNRLMSDLYGEKVRSDWSSRFAPIGNLQSGAGRVFEIANAIMNGHYGDVENQLSGPNFAQAAKMSSMVVEGGNALTRVLISTVKGYDKPQTEEDMMVFFDKLTSLLPVMNNYKQAEWAEASGFFHSRDGQATVAAGKGEAMLRKWLGLRPIEELPLMGAKAKMMGYYGEQGYGDAEGVKKVADEIWKGIVDAKVAHQEDRMSYSEFQDRVAWLTTMRNTALNEVERYQVEKILAKKYLEDAVNTKEKSFVNLMAKGLKGYSMHLEDAEFMLKTMPDFEGRKELMDLIKRDKERADLMFENVE